MSIEASDRHGAAGEGLSGEGPAASGLPRALRLRAIDVVLVLILTAALFVLIGMLVDTAGLRPIALAAVLGLQSAVPIAAVYLVVIRARGLTWFDLGFRPVPRGWVSRAFLIGIATLVALALVNLATQALAGREFRNPQLDFLAPAGFSWEGLAAMLLVVGIIAPIMEEMIFRGLLYGWLRTRIGIAGGTIVSATIFGFAHGIVMLAPALALTGIVLAMVYERSRSLWPAIIVHGTINSVMTAALYAALAAETLPG